MNSSYPYMYALDRPYTWKKKRATASTACTECRLELYKFSFVPSSRTMKFDCERTIRMITAKLFSFKLDVISDKYVKISVFFFLLMHHKKYTAYLL